MQVRGACQALVTAGALVAMAGCSSAPVREHGGAPGAHQGPPEPAGDRALRWLDVREPPTGQPAPGSRAMVAARVFAFGDSQLHYPFGKRTFAQSPFAERMSLEVAVRPAALDDGSDLLLAVFLDEWRRHYADHTPVFLGDAADLSCRQEIAAFTRVLAGAGLTELLAVTSNHDGFYAGNFTSKRDIDGLLAATDMPHDWTRACSEPGRFADHRLTKGRAVAHWRDMLPEAPRWATAAAWDRTGPTEFRDAYLYYVRPLGGGDAGAPPVWGVFLDTVDYRGFDLESSRGAGSAGAVSREQLGFLDRAMFEADIAAGAGPVTFVLFGHHPLRDLEPKSRARVRRFIAVHPDIAAYVSAHAHVSMERRVAVPGGREVPELVVGSTTDAPQAARTLEVLVDPYTGRRLVRTHRLVLDARALCADVAPMARDTLGYTGYRILRDGTPELDVDALDALLFAAGLDDLASERLVQAIGALLMENELVRAWAKLYRGAPLDLDAGDAAVLDAIVRTRYAAGDSVASLRPYLSGTARPAGEPTRYAAWHDPVLSRILAVAEQGVHRFGAHARVFRRLRRLRTRDAAARRYFVCHAIHAAAAEARQPRKDGNVLYIR